MATDAQPAAEKRIRDLETKKLSIHAQIAELKAEYLKLDHELMAAGATTDRIKLLMRW